ncbi:MAG: thioredoxin family protein [Candidatus Dojkabacteria bacterium]
MKSATVLVGLMFFVVIGIIFIYVTHISDNVANEMLYSNEINKSKREEEPVSSPISQDNQKPGEYTSYSSDKLTSDKKNVIFFAAGWCPSCKQLDDNIKANLGNIPSNVNILKADYDLERELKVKYGVTLQHTLVEVDANGNLLKKIVGLYNLYTLDGVLSQLI